MESVPFKTTGIYYRPINEHHLNSSKTSQIWNVITNRSVYNQPLYDVIFFGNLDNWMGNFKDENLDKAFFAEIRFNYILKDFFKYAREKSINNHVKGTDYQNELSFHHLNIDGSHIDFQNKLWKCRGYFHGDELLLTVENLRDNTISKKRFNYFK